jgi:GTP 3',8-cyclase
LTGGEPLLRRNLEQLVAQLRASGVERIALTTNGVLLAGAAGRLRAAGLDAVTVSLDTLRPDRMTGFARSSRHADVIAGIDAARAAGFDAVKLNTVVVRGFNDDEIADIVDFAVARGIEPRFIEYMDVGGATRWNPAEVVSAREILAAIEARHGAAERMVEADPHAPARRFRFAGGVVAGVIASTTAPFCRDCDRLRVTADGTMFTCLYSEHGVDLRAMLRGGADDGAISARIGETWRARADRGAEERAGLAARGVLVPLEGLRADPRREMHVRGG